MATKSVYLQGKLETNNHFSILITLFYLFWTMVRVYARTGNLTEKEFKIRLDKKYIYGCHSKTNVTAIKQMISK